MDLTADLVALMAMRYVRPTPGPGPPSGPRSEPVPGVSVDPRLVERAARLLEMLAADTDGPPATAALWAAVALRAHIPDEVVTEADAELLRLADQWCAPTAPSPGNPTGHTARLPVPMAHEAPGRTGPAPG
ncbi:hypothetical protein [Actinokineospora spheciospongiae]|uniref:hypothetical protein n=1 Tax=Actinokineospora spheciospongiae TaxID=909613 RepID=UPI000D70FA75|nr:hypothetical protein [Actinokineospora spheciospongiae]PWW53156.1 hypothetical protein DFQ13_116146 [Actinokineospora spheciospongiae]